MSRLLPLLVLLLLTACQLEGPVPTVEGTRPPAATATAALVTVDPTVVIPPTPSVVELHVWGPVELSPLADTDVAAVFESQRLAFEAEASDIRLAFEPKAENGQATLIDYLTSASAVAPAILPDLVIFPTTQLDAFAESQLLMPLDPLLTTELRADLYPFALRDMRVGGNWLAIPMTVEIEHGATREDGTRPIPSELEALNESNAPRWLFAGQGNPEGEMSNALLLQLIAAHGSLPAPGEPLDAQGLEALARAFQGAAARGIIPRTVLNLSDESELYRRLENRQADLIESGSTNYLVELAVDADVTFASLPTVTGIAVTVVEGYAIAITSSNPQRQEAAALWLQWLFEARRLAEWNRLLHGLPTTRAGVAETVEDAAYGNFVSGLMESGWMRPGSAVWRDYARTVQEQFRALLQEQITPVDFVDAVSGE